MIQKWKRTDEKFKKPDKNRVVGFGLGSIT